MERHERVAIVVAKFFNERRDTNPYASADTMRALDQIIRNSLADEVARAAQVWRDIYLQQSRVVGTPSRDKPFPDRESMAIMREYKLWADALSGLTSRIHSLPAPANDRVFHRIRDNDQLLELLIALDYQVAGIADSLGKLAGTLTVANARELGPEFSAKVAELESVLRERGGILSHVAG